MIRAIYGMGGYRHSHNYHRLAVIQMHLNEMSAIQRKDLTKKYFKLN